MKKSTQEDLQSIVTKIEKGSFERTDIKALFFDIRDHLEDGDIIREIAHFIAHPTGRNKGITFNHLQKFTDDFVKAAKYGGSFEVKPIFPQNTVIEQLIVDLSSLGVLVNKTLFSAQSAKVMRYLLEVIDDTPIMLKNSNVTDTRIAGTYAQEKKTSLNFTFKTINLENGVLKIPSNVPLEIPVLEVEE